MTERDWAARSRARVWHPCTQMQDHETLPLIPVASAEGPWLTGHDGKRYLDAISSWWTNLFGHRHPRIVERVKQQLDTLDHVLLAGFTHEPAVELAERLCSIAPKGLTRCFYADNGSSAVEVALKMSHHYWRNHGKPEKRKFVALENGYHGETLGALAVGGTGLYRAAYEPLLTECIHVASPDCYNRSPGESWEDHSRRQFVHMRNVLEHSSGEIAAVIVEPLVQFAGGMRMYHPVYLKMLREACTAHGVHLIADEIATGFGRTGQMFGCQWAKVAPDLMCLSKGLTGGTLPLAATLATEDIYQAFYAEYNSGKAFLHSHSYTGNPLACAAALATLDIFGERDWMPSIRDLGHLMWMEVAELLNHPHVAEIRQQGAVLAIEMARDPNRKTPYPREERRGLRVYRHALERGVLLRPLGDVIYFMPPYTVGAEDVKLMAKVAIEGVRLATQD